MNTTPKKKLCWNCEGRVAFADENCPYCGVYLSSSNMINQQNDNSIPIPPYGQTLEKSRKVGIGADAEDLEENLDNDEKTEQDESFYPHQGGSVLPFSLMLAGSIFLVFGLILLLFSREGTLTLHWNASYWFIYLGAAFILLIAGWKTLKD